jgi:hypothetical protein
MDINSLRAVRFQSVAEYGEEAVTKVLQDDLAVHNELVQDLVGTFADPTTDRQRVTGASVSGQMYEVDEYGRGPTQKDQGGTTVAFPLRKFQIALGWTANFMRIKTPADLADQQLGVEKAHLRRIQFEFKRALLKPTNATFRDHLVDNVDLGVKALYNADGAPIPEGPNGETFDGATHTHYLFNDGLDTTAVDALIATVVEHGYGGEVVIFINQGNEAAWRGLTGFTPFVDPRFIQGTADTHVNRPVDITRLDNRAIGYYGAATIWVKPWMVLDYCFCFDISSSLKPLVFRERPGSSMQGLQIAAEIPMYPLYAKYMEAEFGLGVWNRGNGAVLYYATGAVAYVEPTLTLP